MGKEYRLSKTKKRKAIYERAKDRLLPLISATSQSQALDQAVLMGEKYLDRMAEAKKAQEEDKRKIEEIEERMRQRREKWETEEIKFEDI